MSEKFVDPVVAEIHATRDAMLEAVEGDAGELMGQVADRQERSHRQIIREPFRKRTELMRAPESPVRSETGG